MRKIIRIFFTSSLSFGIIWTTVMFFYWKKQGYDITFQRYLSILAKSGFTFGSFLTIFLMSVEGFSIIRLKNKKDATKTIIEKEVIINFNYDNSFERVKKALSVIGAKVVEEDKKDGINAITGMSWKSWGEKLNIKFKRLDDNQTQVVILSNPRIRTTLIDYGKNFENVKKICDEITQNK